MQTKTISTHRLKGKSKSSEKARGPYNMFRMQQRLLFKNQPRGQKGSHFCGFFGVKFPVLYDIEIC